MNLVVLGDPMLLYYILQYDGAFSGFVYFIAFSCALDACSSTLVGHLMSVLWVVFPLINKILNLWLQRDASWKS